MLGRLQPRTTMSGVEKRIDPDDGPFTQPPSNVHCGALPGLRCIEPAWAEDGDAGFACPTPGGWHGAIGLGDALARGAAYTWDELVSFYKKKYNAKQIEAGQESLLAYNEAGTDAGEALC